MMPLGGSGGVNVTWIEVELTSIAISICGAEGTVGNTEIHVQYIIIPDNNFAAIPCLYQLIPALYLQL